MLEVRLFATLRQGREKVYHLDAAGFPDGTAVLDHLHIPKEEVAIFLRNGFHSPQTPPWRTGTLWPFSRPPAAAEEVPLWRNATCAIWGR